MQGELKSILKTLAANSSIHDKKTVHKNVFWESSDQFYGLHVCSTSLLHLYLWSQQKQMKCFSIRINKVFYLPLR